MFTAVKSLEVKRLYGVNARKPRRLLLRGRYGENYGNNNVS